MTGVITRGLLAGLLAVALGACAMQERSIFDSSFWSNSPAKENTEAELGVAALATGDYIQAESHFRKALKANSQDVDALLGMGMLYQKTGRNTKAREMYEAILAIRPKDSQRFMVWQDLNTRPISEIASVRLALLESGGVLTDLGRGESAPVNSGAGGTSVGATPAGAKPAAAIFATPVKAKGSETAARTLTSLSDADANIVSRFKTLRTLRDQGLITPEEYETRRRANIGALLPLTSPPPAAGLDRPVPSAEQISARLRAIGRALELRAVSVGQHAAERTMILNALMPAAPVRVANPGAPPQGLMEAADAVRRLEFLKERGFITSDEYAKERAAVEGAMSPKPTVVATRVAPAKESAGMKEFITLKERQRPAVHLASYRSKREAAKGWTLLRRTYKPLIGNLKADISKVNLGPGKGTFWRLKAGPLKDKAAAGALCRKLRRRRQFCEPSFMAGN